MIRHCGDIYFVRRQCAPFRPQGPHRSHHEIETRETIVEIGTEQASPLHRHFSASFAPVVLRTHSSGGAVSRALGMNLSLHSWESYLHGLSMSIGIKSRTPTAHQCINKTMSVPPPKMPRMRIGFVQHLTLTLTLIISRLQLRGKSLNARK